MANRKSDAIKGTELTFFAKEELDTARICQLECRSAVIAATSF